MRGWTRATVLGLAVCAATGSAWAQRDPVAQRRDLVTRALAAQEAGRHAEALRDFIRAGEIEMRPGLRAELAHEYGALNDGRQACHQASLCVAEATTEASRPETQHVVHECTELATAVCARFGLVRVTLPTPAPDGMHVTIGRRPYDPLSDGNTVVVEPGSIAVHAAANGRTDFGISVEVHAGETRLVTVDLRPVEVPAAVPQRTVLRHENVQAPVARAEPAMRPEQTRGAGGSSGGGGARTFGWVALVGGGVAAVAGIVVFAVREGQISGANPNCAVMNGTSNCPSLYDSTQTLKTVGMAATIGGGVLGLTGLITLLASGGGESHPSGQASVRFRCGEGPGLLGISCGGVF